MKVTVGELRRMIREDYLKGVPEFVFWEATDRYVKDVRQHVERYILQQKSNDALQQREAMEELNDVLDKLRDEVNQLLEDKLFGYVQGL